VVAESHHFNEEQDLDPNRSEKSDPDPHLTGIRMRTCDANPQPILNYFTILVQTFRTLSLPSVFKDLNLEQR